MPVVLESFVPALFGDFNLSIALDQVANRRDLEVWVGDESSVVARIYAVDGDADPITDYTDKAVTMVIGYYQTSPNTTITGDVPADTGEVVFDMSGVDFTRYWGRTRFIIKLALNDGTRAKTIAQGYICVEGNSNPEAWPNDYGFSWGGRW